MSRLRSMMRQRLPPGGGAGGPIPNVIVDAVGWASHPVQLVQATAFQDLRVGSFTTQTDVLSRWSDSSIKMAQITYHATSTGTFSIAATGLAGGSYTPSEWPSGVSVEFVIGGVTWISALPTTFNGSDTFYNGALMREARVYVPPLNGATPHTWLTVIFDIRSYAAGGHRIDCIVTTTKDVAAAVFIDYTVTIKVGGSSVYTRAGNRIPPRSKWRKKFLTSLTEASVRPGVSSLQTLKGLPTYEATAISATYGPFTNGVLAYGGQGYDIMQTGIVAPYFPDTGARVDIAPYPQWVAVYCLYRTADALECTLRHGDLSGSWPAHLTATDGKTLVNIDTLPNWYIGGAATSTTGPLNASVDPYLVLPTTNQQSDVAHQPSLATVPWLLAGDRYYADNMASWANYCMLGQHPDITARDGSSGYLVMDEPRGWAWGMRNIVDAAYWLYDAHPNKTYFTTKAQNNVTKHDTYAEAQAVAGVPFGIIKHQGQSVSYAQGTAATAGAGLNGGAGYADVYQLIIMSPWMMQYMIWSLVHAKQLGHTNGTTALNQMIGLTADFFTDAGIPDSHAMMYWMPHGYRRDSTGLSYLTTLTQCHGMSAAYWGDAQDGSSSGCPCMTTDGYGNQARWGLLAGIGNAVRATDCTTGYNYLMALTQNGVSELNHMNGAPEHALNQAAMTL